MLTISEDVMTKLKSDRKRIRKSKKILYVKTIVLPDLIEHWGYDPGYGYNMYIKCDKEGKIEWENTSIYRVVELIEKNNVKVVT